jgi:hypothetical protein
LLRQRQTFLLLDLHSKRSVAAPALRFIDTPVEVPVFHSVTEAKNYLAHIPLLLGKGASRLRATVPFQNNTNFNVGLFS